jgi:hypothetical protein
MKKRGFDEVMIVNPHDLRSNNQQHVTLMRFHGSPMGYWGQGPEYGWYAEPQEFAECAGPVDGYGEPDYGYYAEPEYGYYAEPEYGWYGETPEMGYWGEPPDYGHYAEAPEYGYYAEPPEYGYYAEPPEYGYYAEPPEYGYAEPPNFGEYEPVGYFAEEQPYGWYGENPEMVGYGEYEPLSEYPENVGWYGEPDYSGYVRETAASAYNPGCPMPTNVTGFGEAEPFAEADPFAGYVKPSTVNASCPQFTPQPGTTERIPETFKPLW